MGKDRKTVKLLVITSYCLSGKHIIVNRALKYSAPDIFSCKSLLEARAVKCSACQPAIVMIPAFPAQAYLHSPVAIVIRA